MIEFEFLHKENEELIYAYYPEGEKDSGGLIGYKPGSLRVIKLSKKYPAPELALKCYPPISKGVKRGTVCYC